MRSALKAIACSISIISRVEYRASSVAVSGLSSTSAGDAMTAAKALRNRSGSTM
ncbi:hypothetical protein [Ensifer adhaerens]